MPIIDIQKLRKAFGPIVAVDDISFSVDKGEVVGFLGPNGAGKSTTMRMLSCFLPPDSGTATVSGFDIIHDPVNARKTLGYVAENVPLYEEMTTAGFLNFICDIRQIRGADRTKALDRVVDSCAIGDVFHQPIGRKHLVSVCHQRIEQPELELGQLYGGAILDLNGAI